MPGPHIEVLGAEITHPTAAKAGVRMARASLIRGRVPTMVPSSKYHRFQCSGVPPRWASLVCQCHANGDFFDGLMNSHREQEGAERVTLLHSLLAADGVVRAKEEGGLAQ